MDANNQGNKRNVDNHGNSGLNSHATQSGLRNNFDSTHNTKTHIENVSKTQENTRATVVAK